jgi:hypothetical protein
MEIIKDGTRTHISPLLLLPNPDVANIKDGCTVVWKARPVNFAINRTKNAIQASANELTFACCLNYFAA